MNKLWLLAIVAVLLLAGACAEDQPGSLALRFEPSVADEPLILNELRYGNPGGEGQFKIRDFRFFLSNIKLLAGSEEYSVSDSYHLVRFDGQEPLYELELQNIPRMPYTEIQLGIGVDEAANGSIESVGDLDPNGRMAWTWDVGYKFILLEGGLERNEDWIPLVYHVGFDENYKTVAFKLAQPLFDLRAETLVFKVDIMKLFTGVTTIDMSTLSNVKFDRTDARRIASNYQTMITLVK